jgi:hypothetical protein
MKNVTSTYYQSIRTIDFEEEELVAKIDPTYKKGDWLKFLGIPVKKIKENLYDWNSFYKYAFCGSNQYVSSEYILNNVKTPFRLDLVDDLILVHRLPYISINGGDNHYFKDDKLWKQYLDVIKGRCKECDNPIYKSIILDNKVID